MSGKLGIGSPKVAGASWQKLPWIPACVEHPRFESGFKSLREGQLRIQRRPAHFEMRVQRLAGEEQAHDFARPFKNRVDAAVPQKSLDRDGGFTACLERVSGLVAAPAANLHCIVDNLPGLFGAPEFAHGGFEPDIR